jgi:ATP-dependent protease ClpP protease subunit
MMIPSNIGKNRLSLLSDIEVLAKQQYGETLEPSLYKLLLEIVKYIPSSAFDEIGSRETGIITFNSEITCSEDENTVDPLVEDLIAFHENAPLSTDLTLLLSSPGGSVTGGMSIISILQRMRTENRKVVIHVTGEACSMGNQILQVADWRSIEPSGILMLHEIAWGVEHASASSHKAESEFWSKQQKVLMSLWTLRTGRPVEYYSQKTANKDWWLTAQEALEENLVDEIITWKQYPTPPALPVVVVPTKKTRKPRKVVPTDVSN